MDKIITAIKAAILHADGTISWTKVCAVITALLGTLIAIPGIFATAGIAVPAFLLPYIKLAAIITATITAFRLKLTAEKSNG